MGMHHAASVYCRENIESPFRPSPLLVVIGIGIVRKASYSTSENITRYIRYRWELDSLLTAKSIVVKFLERRRERNVLT